MSGETCNPRDADRQWCTSSVATHHKIKTTEFISNIHQTIDVVYLKILYKVNNRNLRAHG